MEEILASIRRIISEDDAPPAEAAPAPVEEPPVLMAVAPAPAPVEPEDDDVLELTDTIEAADVETVGDLDVYTPVKAAPEPAWEPEPEPEPVPVFTAAPEPAPAPSYTLGAASTISGGTTIEDLVRSILEPKLNAWADENLPRLVEQIVRDKLSR